MGSMERGDVAAPQYRNIQEATAAWQQSMLHGGSLPMSYFLGLVVPQGSAGSGNGLTEGPTSRTSSGNSTTSGTANSTTNGLTTNQTEGKFTSEEIKKLPPDVRERLLKLIDQNMGRTDFGFTPQEIDEMRISNAESRGLVSQSLRPIAGAANSARDALLMRAAAKGDYAPGLNATVEEVQREQGRAGGLASQETLLGVAAANRAATLAAANARIQDQQNTRAQTGNLLTGFGESNTTGSGSSSATSNGTSNSTTNGTSTGTTNETGLTTTGPSTPSGTILPATGGLAPGSTGVGAKRTPAPAAPSVKKPTNLMPVLAY